MSKPVRLSQIRIGDQNNTAAPIAKGRHEMLCKSYGCIIAAAWNNECVFHMEASRQRKDPADVSTRIRNRRGLVSECMRLINAPYQQNNDGEIVAVKLIYSSEDERRYWVESEYPHEIPRRKGESHTAWRERAMSFLIKEIVSEARKNDYAH